MGTITVNPPSTTSPYPVIEDVLSLVRSLLNDTFAGATGTPGEGRVFTDGAPFVMPLLNYAMQMLALFLEGHSVPKPTVTVIISGITPVNGPLGLSVPDPSITQNLSFDGFFDGLQTNNAITLPADFATPKKLEQRPTNSGLTFAEVESAADGVDSRYQDFSLGTWEFSNDRLIWNGSLVEMDIRLRYVSATQFLRNVPTTAFSTTTMPWLSCQMALANFIAGAFNESRVPGSGATFMANYRMAALAMVQRYVRQMQNIDFSREAYGEDGDLFGWFG